MDHTTQLSRSGDQSTAKPEGQRPRTLRGMRPAAELAQNKAHGHRVRYIAGCRCDQCRAANNSYERERAKARKSGDWNGIVSAEPARQHLLALQQKGVGKRAVASCTDLSVDLIAEIRLGRRPSVRARTERLILAVTTDMASDGARVRAGKTLTLINQLLDEGFTKTALAGRLGYKSPQLQVGKKNVTVRLAYRIERLHAQLTA